MRLSIAIDPDGPEVLAVTATGHTPSETEVRTLLRRVAVACWAMADSPDYDTTEPEGETTA